MDFPLVEEMGVDAPKLNKAEKEEKANSGEYGPI